MFRIIKSNSIFRQYRCRMAIATLMKSLFYIWIMEKVELLIEKNKAAKLINFLKELDFVEVKEIKKNKKSLIKNIDDIIVPATNPRADISSVFGAWRNTVVSSSDIRNSSRKTGQLQW